MEKPVHLQNFNEALEGLLKAILDKPTTKIPSKYTWFQEIRPFANRVRATKPNIKQLP